MSDDSCMDKCLGCLATVPSASLTAWVLMVVSVSACGGGLMVAAERTRDLLDMPNMYPFSDIICLSVVFGMVVMGIFFLVVALLSTGPASRKIFNTSRKNSCAAVLNGFTLFLMILLTTAWVLMVSVLTIPMALWLCFFILHKLRQVPCIDLSHYAITEVKREICGNELNTFYDKSQDMFLCYVIAYVAAVFVVLCMIFFIICTNSNYIYLKESRLTTYNVYKEEVHSSKNSVIDTHM